MDGRVDEESTKVTIHLLKKIIINVVVVFVSEVDKIYSLSLAYSTCIS